ncbi:MAG: hypothetical protein C3F13_17465 [Anaerolineales bacterium]|nr:hypothetical protein [Anaerolineae bacterium]PWB50255.1 MAG: hypothetical protein C3F13_17465 [Anaerolineales bacterium]
MPSTDPFLTIFTAPKPFTEPHISLIQRNAIQSWLHLGDEVDVLLVGDEPGMAEFAAEAGLLHLPNVTRNQLGTPLVSSIFSLARQASTSPLLAYVNADVLLTPQILDIARQVYCQAKQFLIVGQRYDLDVQQPLEFNAGWEVQLQDELQRRGRLHPPAGSDYFIFPRTCFTDLPSFSIGRAGWDNWMIYNARLQHMPVVDATASIPVIHQDHDYSHLPNGQPHYRLPESSENTRLAGGRRSIFHLEDADYSLQDGQLKRIPLRGRKLLRQVETYPLLELHSRFLADISFAVFHPVKAWKEFRGRLAYKLSHSHPTHA